MDNGITKEDLPNDNGSAKTDKRRRRGSEHPNFGRKKSPEQREQHRQWMLANAPNRGQRKPEEVREKIRESLTDRVHVLLERRGITQEEFDRAKDEGKRWCSGGCKAFVPADQFSKSKSGYCNKCNALYVRRYKARKNFGMESEQFEAMDKQSLCQICGFPQTPADHALCIDHDHKTGKVRGMLCRQCNFGVERLDNIENWTDKALTYLARY